MFAPFCGGNAAYSYSDGFIPFACATAVTGDKHPQPCRIKHFAPPPLLTKVAQNRYYKRVGRVRDIEVETTSLSL